MVDCKRFMDQVVIVTGAANGIGRACALRFSEEGAHVVCLDIDITANETTARICSENGTESIAYKCDVSNLDEVSQAVAMCTKKWGMINVLVAAAGIYSGSALEEIDLNMWQRVIDVNLKGVLICNKLVVPIMKKQRAGSIINVSSIAGKTSFKYNAEYSSAKTGVIGLTRSVALELAPFQVTVNALCPGNTLTALLQKIAENVGPREGMTPEAWLKMRANDCPQKRLAEPWEMAGVAAFLASKDARHITGQSIEVDGGMVLC